MTARVLGLVEETAVQEREHVLHRRSYTAHSSRLIALSRHSRLRGIQRGLPKIREQQRRTRIERAKLGLVHFHEPDINANLR